MIKYASSVDVYKPVHYFLRPISFSLGFPNQIIEIICTNSKWYHFNISPKLSFSKLYTSMYLEVGFMDGD